MQMKKLGENRLNIEHHDESQTLMKPFALMLPRRVAELQNQAQRLQNECRTPFVPLLRLHL